MRDKLQPPAPDPDAPAPSTPIAYWRREFWRPYGYSDSVGLFADLGRRLLSRPLRLRWRLHVSARIRAVAETADEQTARAAVRAALYSYDTVVALSRAECDAVPPWRPLGIATSADIPGQVYGLANGDGAWRCFTRMAATFTVDVTDAAWPDRYFAIDIVTAPSTSRLSCLEVDGVHIAHRRPTWR